MSQTFTQMLEKVEEFHDKHDFANKENNGHDMSYRILLTIEELGELAECFTKGKSKNEKAEQMEKNGKEMITRIAALLPEKNHGVCLGDAKIPIYQKENGIKPKPI